MCSFDCFSYGNVIYGTSCFYFLNYLSCGDVICGTSIVCRATCTIILIAYTTIGIADGSTLFLIIFCALTFVLSYSLFIPKLEAPPSSTLFFLLRVIFGEFIATFFLFSNVVFIFSLVFLTLANGFYDSPFDAQTYTERFLPIPRQIDKYFSYPLYSP